MSQTRSNFSRDNNKLSRNSVASNNSLSQSQRSSQIAPASNDVARPNPTNKKQAARERGLKLQEIIRERRANGTLKKAKAHRSKSSKAFIFFSITRILKSLKKMNPRMRVQETSAVLMAGVLEYLTAELLELAGNMVKEQKKKTIKPRHIFLAIAHDREFEEILRDVTIVQSGVRPNINPALLTSKSSKISHKRKSQDQDTDEAQAPTTESRGKRQRVH